MKIYMIGGRGRLGRALSAAYHDAPVVLLERAAYEAWAAPNSGDKVSRYFADKAKAGALIFVASGLVDPGLPQEDLWRVNFMLPKNIIEGAAKLGIKVITFGTVMESLLKSKNPYIQTKTLLGDYVGEVASGGMPALHIRIHTLYGLGEPSPFMFLGQICHAIRKNLAFDMTLGRQLREYHHVNDEAKAIRKLVGLAPPGVISLDHGAPVTLKEIADSVFTALGKSGLLHVGALPEPQEENYEKVFCRSDMLQDMVFRDTVPGVVGYMQECCLPKTTADNGAFV